MPSPMASERIIQRGLEETAVTTVKAVMVGEHERLRSLSPSMSMSLALMLCSPISSHAIEETTAQRL